jgi:hypothetical protein
MLNRFSSLRPAVFASLALLSSCASTLTDTPASQLGAVDCIELDSELANSKETAHAAAQARSDSWVVLPIAVFGRYASAASAESQAEMRLAAFRKEQQRKGCVETAG